MKSKILVFIIPVILLTGCLERNHKVNPEIVTNVGGSDSESFRKHNPEPVTTALVGGGLIAYAFLKRKGKKK